MTGRPPLDRAHYEFRCSAGGAGPYLEPRYALGDLDAWRQVDDGAHLERRYVGAWEPCDADGRPTVDTEPLRERVLGMLKQSIPSVPATTHGWIADELTPLIEDYTVERVAAALAERDNDRAVPTNVEPEPELPSIHDVHHRPQPGARRRVWVGLYGGRGGAGPGVGAVPGIPSEAGGQQ